MLIWVRLHTFLCNSAPLFPVSGHPDQYAARDGDKKKKQNKFKAPLDQPKVATLQVNKSKFRMDWRGSMDTSHLRRPGFECLPRFCAWSLNVMSS